ncbi:hypothetical protein [Streptacidiphilus fuscans]|uniref:Uncharacterized protein n=1 Tax=Streptacidiphilus fuscans TaxID=2789292 RepID=A0A931B7P4_9ACTN|nr:hypothetical protein [Streptacidiphilus fuscans]MBF9070546.1 hypothetical protein [Streptacidiphilus fuscans]
MSLLTTLARLEAVRSGRAQPLATVRHRHLAERPFVLVPLTAAGETGAPLAALLGCDRERPVLLTVPQPLDRDLRFAFLARLADELLPYLEGFGESVELIERTGKDPESGERTTEIRELCAEAPQLIVPNQGGIEWLGVLGRSMRFRRTAEDADPGPFPAPPRVPLLGRWLTHLAERAQVPGSSLLLPLTGVLARHWATGQSSLEDAHLGALLGWIAPPDGERGESAALRAENGRDAQGQLVCPPAGPATDPDFDRAVLGPAITRYDAARDAARVARDGAAAQGVDDADEAKDFNDLSGESADRALAAHVVAARAAEIDALLEAVLLPVWQQVWQGIDLLRTLPPGAHVAERWEGDRWSYTGHRDRLAAGEPPQPIRDDAVTAARKLAQREREQTRLDLQEALDDPLAMAEHRLAGQAFAGEVVSVEPAYDTSGRSPKPRPLVTVRTADRPHVEAGSELHRANGPSAQKAELAGVDEAAGLLTVRLLSGMGRKKEPEPRSVPEPGDQVCFTLFELSARQSAPLPEPEDTPWTHGGPPQ